MEATRALGRRHLLGAARQQLRQRKQPREVTAPELDLGQLLDEIGARVVERQDLGIEIGGLHLVVERGGADLRRLAQDARLVRHVGDRRGRAPEQLPRLQPVLSLAVNRGEQKQARHVRLAAGPRQRERQLLLGGTRIAEPFGEQLRQLILRLDACRSLGQHGDQLAEGVRGGVPFAALLLHPGQTTERAGVPRLVAQHLPIGLDELARIGPRKLPSTGQDLDVAIPAPLPAIEVLQQRHRAAVLRLQRQRGLGGLGGLVELRAPGLVPERDLHPQIGRLLLVLEPLGDLGGDRDELGPEAVSPRDPLHFLDHPPAGRILGQRRLQGDQRPVRVAEPALINLGNLAEHGRPLGACGRGFGLHQQRVDPRGPVFARRHQRLLGIEGVRAHPSALPLRIPLTRAAPQQANDRPDQGVIRSEAAIRASVSQIESPGGPASADVHLERTAAVR